MNEIRDLAAGIGGISTISNNSTSNATNFQYWVNVVPAQTVAPPPKSVDDDPVGWLKRRVAEVEWSPA